MILKVTGIIISILLSSWIILTLIKIWGDVISWGSYIKLTITLALVAAGVGIIGVIINEINKENKMKKDRYID
ncbi:MAG: hypothetical protein GXN91_05440 [Epsilonproteobacteria bacterium]|nr:hypothetical protein [Campylobacterota bacterium]